MHIAAALLMDLGPPPSGPQRGTCKRRTYSAEVTHLIPELSSGLALQHENPKS